MTRSLNELLLQLVDFGYHAIVVSAAPTPARLKFDRRLNGRLTVLRKQNIGYDFGSWAVGLAWEQRLLGLDNVILTNDSLAGPFAPIDGLLQAFEGSQADAFALTDNSQFGHHLQSFFLGFRNGVLAEPPLARFWSRIRHEKRKEKIILRNEVGLSQMLRREGYSVDVAFPHAAVVNHWQNPTIDGWGRLLDLGFPFVKRELLRRARSSPLTVPAYPTSSASATAWRSASGREETHPRCRSTTGVALPRDHRPQASPSPTARAPARVLPARRHERSGRLRHVAEPDRRPKRRRLPGAVEHLGPAVSRGTGQGGRRGPLLLPGAPARAPRGSGRHPRRVRPPGHQRHGCPARHRPGHRAQPARRPGVRRRQPRSRHPSARLPRQRRGARPLRAAWSRCTPRRASGGQGHELSGTGERVALTRCSATFSDRATTSSRSSTAFAANRTSASSPPRESVLGPEMWGDNQPTVRTLLRRIELSVNEPDLVFAAGSMYWARGVRDPGAAVAEPQRG